MEMSGQLHAPATLCPVRETPVSIVGGSLNPKSWSGHYGEKKTMIPLISSP